MTFFSIQMKRPVKHSMHFAGSWFFLNCGNEGLYIVFHCLEVIENIQSTETEVMFLWPCVLKNEQKIEKTSKKI